MTDNDKNLMPMRQEVYRKLTHLGALVIPCGYYYLDLSRGTALAIMIPVTAVMIFIDIARLRGWKMWDFIRPIISPIVRSHEMRGDFTGAFYILISSTLSIALFPKPIAIASIAFIIVGDTAAALIGRKFGKHKFRTKSFEGSLAFLVAALLVAWAAPQLSFKVGVIGAIVAAVTEGISFKIDDNTSVPLVSGLVMYLLTLPGFLPYFQ